MLDQFCYVRLISFPLFSPTMTQKSMIALAYRAENLHPWYHTGATQC
jgi:hypothetical protein